MPLVSFALSAKISSNDPKSGKAQDIFDAATVNAAQAFGFDAGVIAVGKEADALLIDLDAPEMIGDYNLVSNLVYAASNRVIDTVICDGRILMQNGMKEKLKMTQYSLPVYYWFGIYSLKFHYRYHISHDHEMFKFHDQVPSLSTLSQPAFFPTGLEYRRHWLVYSMACSHSWPLISFVHLPVVSGLPSF